MKIKLRNFLVALAALPLTGCIHWPGIDNRKKRALKVGDIVKWNEWACYPSRANWATLSIVTCDLKNGMVLLDDRRGIHSSQLTKVGHSDDITASCGVIHDKPSHERRS